MKLFSKFTIDLWRATASDEDLSTTFGLNDDLLVVGRPFSFGGVSVPCGVCIK